eukprot:5522280-Prymnesium_polylepis.1
MRASFLTLLWHLEDRSIYKSLLGGSRCQREPLHCGASCGAATGKPTTSPRPPRACPRGSTPFS